MWTWGLSRDFRPPEVSRNWKKLIWIATGLGELFWKRCQPVANWGKNWATNELNECFIERKCWEWGTSPATFLQYFLPSPCKWEVNQRKFLNLPSYLRTECTKPNVSTFWSVWPVKIFQRYFKISFPHEILVNTAKFNGMIFFTKSKTKRWYLDKLRTTANYSILRVLQIRCEGTFSVLEEWIRYQFFSHQNLQQRRENPSNLMFDLL